MRGDVRDRLKQLGDVQRSSRSPVEIAELEPSHLALPRRQWSGPVVAFVVMAAVLLVTGGLALLLGTAAETPPADTVTPPNPVVPTTTHSSPSTSADEGVELRAADLVWQRVDLTDVFGDLEAPLGASVFDGGASFVVYQGGGLPATIRTSADGMSWDSRPMEDAVAEASLAAAWEDTVLLASGGGGWSREENSTIFDIPSLVSVARPDGSVSRRIFDGDVGSVALGPAGMIVVTTPHNSYGAVIDEVLGPEFVESLYEASVRDGVLHVETVPEGRTAEIVLADHGLTEDDLNSDVAGWYSESGTDWAPVPDISSGMKVVGTGDGFIGVDGSTAWHSADGTTWVQLGDLSFTPSVDVFNQLAMRWREGAVVTDFSRYAYVSAEGIVPMPDSPIGLSSGRTLSMSGGLGILVVNPTAGRLLFTPDGESWEVGQLPEDMTDSFGWYNSSGAVTNEAILLLLWEEREGGQQPAWWLGTFPEVAR